MTASKLTLRMESDLIRQAKELAKERDVSLSKLVADYFTALARLAADRQATDAKLPPITASLQGVAAGSDLSEQDYHRYLEEKHL